MIARTGGLGGHFAFLPSLYPIVNVEITNVIKATNSIMVIMHQSLLHIFLLKRYLRVVRDYQGEYLQEGNRHRFGNTKDIISNIHLAINTFIQRQGAGYDRQSQAINL